MVWLLEFRRIQSRITNVKDLAVASGNYTSCAYVTRRQSEKKTEHSELKCFGCKQIGHVKAKCPYRLKKDRSFAQRKKSDKQSTAITNFAANCLYGSKGFESSDDWFLDSGATTHLSRRNDWLEKYNRDKSNTVGIANGSQIRSTGCGTVKIPLATKKTMVAKDVHHAPELAVNLLSVSRIASHGKSLIFDINGCRIVDILIRVPQSHVLGTASQHQGLYRLDRPVQFGLLAGQPHDLWHRRLGHLSRGSMKLLLNGMTNVKDLAVASGNYTSCAYVTRRQSEKKTEHSELKCFGCKQIGHVKAKCPYRLKKDRSFAQRKKSDKQSTAITNFAANCLYGSKGFESSDDWFLDSGATTHLSRRNDWLEKYNRDKSNTVGIANGSQIRSTGCGTVKIPLATKKTMVAKDVHHAPELAVNLLSVSRIASHGKSLIFDINGCRIVDIPIRVPQSHVLGTASQHQGLYRLDRPVQFGLLAGQPHDLWHRRLGHLSRGSMKLLLNGMVTGIPKNSVSNIDCITCVKGKQCRLPFPKLQGKRATNLLDVVHSDICGPMQVRSFSGARYFISFIDDFSRKSFVYFLKNKNEALQKFKEFVAFVERKTSRKVKCLRTDNGREYVNEHFAQFLTANGIRHERSIPDTPEQNGIAERLNRTLVEKARTMLIDAGLSTDLWAEAIGTANYLRNRCPTKALRNVTPEEAWSGRKPNLSHLKVFGCLAMVHIRQEAAATIGRRKRFPTCLVGRYSRRGSCGLGGRSAGEYGTIGQQSRISAHFEAVFCDLLPGQVAIACAGRLSGPKVHVDLLLQPASHCWRGRVHPRRQLVR
ncbi:hypothetical protein M514_24458 [Trichuris suis]|uniref:Integrase core domain protein n=1 Tax=Trichuris suis TaxID=68888 RepID=A0A085N1M5_9BILA|nr:hypothetical protein M514_24458 [Trichuris suis]